MAGICNVSPSSICAIDDGSADARVRDQSGVVATEDFDDEMHLDGVQGIHDWRVGDPPAVYEQRVAKAENWRHGCFVVLDSYTQRRRTMG